MVLVVGLLVNSKVPKVSGQSLKGSEEAKYFKLLLKKKNNLSAVNLCDKMVRRVASET